MKRLMLVAILILAVPSSASAYLSEGPTADKPGLSKARAKRSASATLKDLANGRAHELAGCTREFRSAFKCRGSVESCRYVVRVSRVWVLRPIEPNYWGVAGKVIWSSCRETLLAKCPYEA